MLKANKKPRKKERCSSSENGHTSTLTKVGNKKEKKGVRAQTKIKRYGRERKGECGGGEWEERKLHRGRDWWGTGIKMLIFGWGRGLEEAKRPWKSEFNRGTGEGGEVFTLPGKYRKLGRWSFGLSDEEAGGT